MEGMEEDWMLRLHHCEHSLSVLMEANTILKKLLSLRLLVPDLGAGG